ncbi:MAG: UDP-glucose/GDP-mannose dehydrogenase family protein [Terriglobales bacterium]|jgi:UDPglucose 6-dehydrogenase
MKLSVIGAGYVGLTTAACLAQVGHDVFCSESDAEKLSKLQNGVMPLFEPHLEDVIESVRKVGRLRFGSTEEAIAWGEAIFICVGTPPLPNGDADLSAIEGVARAIAKRASGYRLVIEKSTVPVQTGGQLQKHLSVHSKNGLSYDVASNPEFLREGSSVEDFLHPDRIVIGVDSPRAEDLLRQIYEPIIQQKFTCPIHLDCPKRREPIFLATDTNSAELIKHASNSFLAMKISFINMVANLCEAVGADVAEVAKGMGLDPRIGPAFLNPGIGFGGFCFPKDVQAFIRIAEKSGCDFSLLKEVEKINQNRVGRFIEKLRAELWVLRGKKVAVWGLAFKPNTDDVRFAPSITLVKSLLEEGAIVSAYDPEAMEKARIEIPSINYCADPYQAAQGAEAILIVTEWDEFLHLDWHRLGMAVERSLILDGRNMLDASEIKSHGFHYFSVGRPPVLPAQSVCAASEVASLVDAERRS